MDKYARVKTVDPSDIEGMLAVGKIGKVIQEEIEDNIYKYLEFDEFHEEWVDWGCGKGMPGHTYMFWEDEIEYVSENEREDAELSIEFDGFEELI